MLKGGAEYGALATRVIGDRLWEEGGLPDFGDRGLWDDSEPSTRYDCGRELVCNGEGVICREPGAGPGR